MSGIYKITVDMEPIKKALNDIDDQYKRYVERDILLALARGAAREVKRKYSSMLNKRSGNLYRSVKAGLAKNKKSAYVTSNASKPYGNGKTVRYGWVLARGANVKQKKAKALRFQVDGKWVAKHSVTIPPREWITMPGNAYLHSADAQAAIDKVLNRWVEKMRAKGVLE